MREPLTVTVKLLTLLNVLYTLVLFEYVVDEPFTLIYALPNPVVIPDIVTFNVTSQGVFGNDIVCDFSLPPPFAEIDIDCVTVEYSGISSTYKAVIIRSEVTFVYEPDQPEKE